MKNYKKNFHQSSFAFCFQCLFPSLQRQSSYTYFVFCQFRVENGEIKTKKLHTEEQSIRLEQSIIADRRVIYFSFIHANRKMYCYSH